MKLLINRDSTAETELRSLTGAYYASNDFERIKTDWLLAQEQIQKLVGKEVLQRALDHYHGADYLADGSDAEQAINDDLVQHLQLPIAIDATMRYYAANLVSHEDTGRKVQIDAENEKMAFEWMLDRDDAAHNRKLMETSDRLIRFLEENNIEEWMASPRRKAIRSLFINNVELFHQSFPIDQSASFFFQITPFISEVQQRKIRPALGEHYDALLQYWQQLGTASDAGGLPGEPTEQELFLSELLERVQAVMPLFAINLAVIRLSLQALPYGVVQQFRSESQSRHASSVPPRTDVIAWASLIIDSANEQLDDIKQFIQSSSTEEDECPLIPENDESNKFLRT